MKTLVIAVGLGALLGYWAYTGFEARTSPEADQLATLEFPRCLGQRSKAQRIAYWRQRTGTEPISLPTDAGDASVTFNRDIAPILFERCAVCHRPGEVTPFSVLTYEDVKPWAWVIGVVTERRYMPPWPPGDRADAQFEGERKLDDAEIALIKKWIDEGAAQGDAADLPPAPNFPDTWLNGEPDLIVTLEEPFLLPADGVDVYRNLVLPLPVDQVRWIRSVEIKPGNKRTVHHAVMQIDRFGTGRRLDEAEPGVGFGGMEMGSTENPGGHFIGWSPGKMPNVVPEDMAWKIGPGTDIVLQLHMLPSGEVETIKPQIGLYYADKPSTRQPFSLVLRNSNIDIPAGETTYTVEDDVTLPVDLQVLGVYPHAHYLAKDVKAVAALPDGRELTLIHISDWDFGWQDEYRYSQPVELPAGTRLSMRYVYDNSAENPKNPSSPPRRVMAGNSSLDEMAILMLQVITEGPNSEAQVREAVMRSRLEKNPNSWFAHNLLGAALRAQGKTDEAIEHFLAAGELNPGYAGIAYNLGNALQARGDFFPAIGHYQRALKLQPLHGQVHNNLGTAYLNIGQFKQAAEHFRRQLSLNAMNTEVLVNLGTALAANGDVDEARQHFQSALHIEPEFLPARIGLADSLRASGNSALAVEQYKAIIATTPNAALAHLGVGVAYGDLGTQQLAMTHLREAVRLDKTLVMALNGIAWDLATSSSASHDEATRATQIAELADQITNHSSPEILDTLAAAYASGQRFELAAQTLRSALSLINAGHVYEPEFRKRLALYEAHKRYSAEPTN